MSSRTRRKRHYQRSMPAVIVRQSRDERAETQDSERLRTLASLRASLRELAGLDEMTTTAADADTARETRAALSSLVQLTPDVLARMPDLAGRLHEVAQLADERLRAGGLAAGGSAIPTAMATRSASHMDLLREAPTGSSPVASGNASGWAGMGLASVRHDAMGVPNADYLRRLAVKNPWVQAAITTRKQQIGRADITVMPDDPLTAFDASIQDAVEDLLNYPNELKDSYRSLIEPTIDDILTLDRGCISKDLDARGVPHHLYVEDGATIRIFADWKGEPDKPHYLFVPPGSAPGLVGSDQGVALLNDQLICIMANAASYRFGLAPTQVLLDTIRGDLAATEKAMALVRDVPPPHLVNVKTSAGSGVAQQTIDRIRTEYERRIAGQREVMFMGADDLQVYPLIFSLKDNQFMEWQTYLARKICAVFQISPQQIGITFDINKATAETQQDVFEDSGLIPLMLLLEEFLNRELLADFAPKRRQDGRPDMRKLNLRVFYPEISELARMRHAERVIKTAASGLASLPLLTPNDANEMLGKEPIPGGNTRWVMTTNGPMPWLSYDNDYGNYGTFPTPGDLGAQDPEGGVDEDAAEPKDVSNEQADRSNPTAGGETTVGNDSTGNGDQPNLNDADNNPVSNGNQSNSSGSSSGKSARRPLRRTGAPTPRPVPMWLLRACDARKPGAQWSPAADSLTRQRAAAVAAHGAFPARYISGFTLNGDDTDVLDETIAAAPLLQLVAGRAVDARKTDEPSAKSPKPVGHVSAHVAAAHTPPYQQREAETQLATEVRAIFESAQKRGQRA